VLAWHGGRGKIGVARVATEEGDVAKLDKLIAQAREHLDEGEDVVSAVQGTYETKIAGNDSVRKGAFIATDRRLVFYAKKLTGYDLESYPYDHISSIEMGKSMMGHQVTFFASGNKVHMKWIDGKQDVAGFISTVRARMKGGARGGADTGATPEPDLSDQIRRLAQLRDEGLVTEEEFQAKKAQLLGL
jgi:hypothetical protein